MASGIYEDKNKLKYGACSFPIDFAEFAPKPYIANPCYTKYYIRAIALVPISASSEKYTAYLSITRQVFFGQPEAQDPVVIYPSLQVPVYNPDVRIKSYQPLNMEQPMWQYHFVVWKEPPSFPIPWNNFYGLLCQK